MRTTIQALVLLLAAGVPAAQSPASDKTAVQEANDQFVREWTKAAMHWDINQRLQRMENLKSPADQRAINCSTCHRGAVDPHEPQ